MQEEFEWHFKLMSKVETQWLVAIDLIISSSSSIKQYPEKIASFCKMICGQESHMAYYVIYLSNTI